METIFQIFDGFKVKILDVTGNLGDPFFTMLTVGALMVALFGADIYRFLKSKFKGEEK